MWFSVDGFRGIHFWSRRFLLNLNRRSVADAHGARQASGYVWRKAKKMREYNDTPYNEERAKRALYYY